MISQNLILATAGHVDHGKTALIKALTGTDTDRLPEEKARGITIDLGFAHLSLPGFFLGVIDVPGHEDFIRNMIAGIGSIDLALLVVAADDGWMAQTEEHLQILDYLGVRRGVVAITKSDLGDAERVAAEVRERLRGNSLGQAPIVATSVRSATGLDLLVETLAEVCSAIPPAREIGKPRLFVDRVFTVRGSGTVVTGTLTRGRLTRGEPVSLQPQNLRARVRALQSHNKLVEIALPATRTALNLPDLQPNEIPRGSVLTSAGAFDSSRALDVLLERSARSVLPPRALKCGSLLQVHYGSARLLARVTLFDRAELPPGERSVARLCFPAPVFAFVGDRFIVRDASAQRTIAGGLVLDADADGMKFRSRAQRDLLTARAAAPNDLGTLLRTQLRRDRFAQEGTLLVKSNFSREEIEAALEELKRTGDVFQRKEFVADAAWWLAFCERARETIDAGHTAHPNQAGTELTQLRATLEINDPPLFDALIGHLCEAGFERAGVTIRRRGHRPSLPPLLQRAGAEIRTALAARPFDPPARKELIRAPQAREALRFLCETGEAVSLNEEVILSAAGYAQMKTRITQTLRLRGPATTSELRQALGTTRRVVVPLLEHFDRAGLTIRQGDRRALRAGLPTR